MPLNKASLFQLTQNSQLNITVSAHVHVCTNVLVMHNVYVCICILCLYTYDMRVCMYILSLCPY